MVSLYLLYKTISSGLAGKPSRGEEEQPSEIESIIIGILTHKNATDAIKVATKLLVKEYENISAMENRFLLMTQDEESKPGVQENLAHSNVKKKIKTMETRFMQILLWLETDEVQKVEAACADVLLRHQAVKRAHTNIKTPRGQ